MRFSVDAWDVGYGSALNLDDADLPASAAQVNTNVEVPESRWAPIAPADGLTEPSAVLFVDGVRRIDARVWIDDLIDPFDAFDDPAASTASMAVCASYAAGVVCCCGRAGRRQAHLLAANVRRGLFTIAPHARDIATRSGSYQARRSVPSDSVPLTMVLSNALQKALAGLEVDTAGQARTALARAHETAGRSLVVEELDDYLLVIDGPLRYHGHLKRALGFIKTHRAEYLPSALNGIVAALDPGERSPVFLMGTSWERYAWYLRLPSVPDVQGAPWAGVVRCEATTELSETDVIALANLSQTVLCRYASVTYKDSRAPQNLVPIAGLEGALRHRLGDARIMYRALRQAATHG
ncbi:hypothetical protein EV644_1246 [Kribbella orskensis]|uniref:NurA domain-containing protein n=1 Tax=Kribbella orskensis TaxID=2512216 RepID=A0ABY2B9Z7_9ACTN|nr:MULTISPECIES: hypothetical protein [Kribbella]TCN32800.1 hypothetical protein EV642_12692 [Kribbella sp. VKM Ac-2500]TCO12882.1 hypothetical protein EV644_1246 [Kribbella orskensis]